jgi:hypothetical protein
MFLQCPPKACQPLKVYRERKNIDLTLEFPENGTLLIENKVKSMPSQSQLEDYAKAVKDKDQTSFLLISLARPTFVPSNSSAFAMECGAQWHLLSYRDLAAALEGMLPAISSANAYHGQLLTDYLNVVRGLDKLQLHFHVDLDGDGSFFGLLDDLRDLKSIRLHDLIDKLRCDQLAERLRIRLTKEGFALTPGQFTEGDTGQVFVNTDMTRGSALLDFKYVLERVEEEPVALGVQVQGREFKLVARMEDAAKCRPLAKELIAPTDGSKRIWFDFSFAPTSEKERPSDQNTFKKFGGGFLYRSRKLLDVSARDIVNSIIAYARLIRDNDKTLREQALRGLTT